MSEIHMITAAVQGLSTAVGGVNATLLTLAKGGVAAYQDRTKEMARRTDLLAKLTMDGQSIPVHMIVQPAPTEETPADGLAQAAEEAAGEEGAQPPAEGPGAGQQV